MPGVLTFLTKRVLLGLPILWAVLTIVFVFLRMSGDPVSLFVSPANATEAELARVRAELGFDQPIYVQYGMFLQRAAVADFGVSLMFRQSAIDIVLARLPNTLYLATASVLIALVFGVAAGVSAASFGGRTDQVVSLLAVLGQTMPSFWLGLILMLVFASQLGWLPATGSGSVRHIVLPAATLGIYMTARTARLTRSSMLDVINQDYIRTARAKGLGVRVVILGHALRNALIPVVTITAVTFATLIGNSVVVEEVFAWPGIGRLLVESVFARDYPLVQATVFVIAVLVLSTSILLDAVYAFIDPRIKVS